MITKRIIPNHSTNPIELVVRDGVRAALTWSIYDEQASIFLSVPYRGAYGMGEKYNGFNQKGKRVINKVEEKFCFQGESTYCATPFFWTDTGIGLYIQTDEITEFDFQEQINIICPADAVVYVFTGNPCEIIGSYQELFGSVVLPPKWAFGPWISANRWNSQKDVENQIEKLREHDFPATVLVVEAWSDEATFYIFNGARYIPKPDGEALLYEDFDFSESPWTDPAGLIENLHEQGIRFVLWQIPVYKKPASDESECQQNNLDQEDAIKKGLCVFNQDKTPYTIPEGHWFSGSMIPDFTNPDTLHLWFNKRKYLLDIGVDGFKTDGGEFIYSNDVQFFDRTTGKRGKNNYAQKYTQAYHDFIGNERVLFSRAGYAGQHCTPILWAGDQQSQNDELRSALSAGLSAALSGILFWSFDIGGFAGQLPSLDLYRRATQMACFCPVMQWHSEPDGGQFKKLMPGYEGNNERSPWNIATAYSSPELLTELRFWYKLRMNLLPYIYSVAMFSAETGEPMMRPLVFDWSQDIGAIGVTDQYMLGESLMVAPVLEENVLVRSVYLPEGDWIHLFYRDIYEGGRVHDIPSNKYIPVFIKNGTGLALNALDEKSLGLFDGNSIDTKNHLHFLLAGETGSYAYKDDDGSNLNLSWVDGKLSVQGFCVNDYTWGFIN